MGLNPLVQRVFKGLFDRNKTSFVSPFDVRRCSPHRRPVREDGSGSVSAQLVARSARWSNGRWQRGSSLRTGATSSTVSFRGSCLTTGANLECSIARCITLVQVQDADGPRRRRWRCEELRRTRGRSVALCLQPLRERRKRKRERERRREKKKRGRGTEAVKRT